MRDQAGIVLPVMQKYFFVWGSKFYLYYKIFLTYKKRTDNKSNELVISTSGFKKTTNKNVPFMLADCFPCSPPPWVTVPPGVGHVHVLLYFYNTDLHMPFVLCVLKLCVNDIRPCSPLSLVTLCFRVSQVEI